MFRKLTPLLTIAILLGAVSAPVLAQTSRADEADDFLATESCELHGYPDCHSQRPVADPSRYDRQAPADHVGPAGDYPHPNSSSDPADGTVGAYRE